MWEYLIEKWTGSNLSSALQNYLNEKGKEGWELVHYEDVENESYISDSCRLIWKRLNMNIVSQSISDNIVENKQL